MEAWHLPERTYSIFSLIWFVKLSFDNINSFEAIPNSRPAYLAASAQTAPSENVNPLTLNKAHAGRKAAAANNIYSMHKRSAALACRYIGRRPPWPVLLCSCLYGSWIAPGKAGCSARQGVGCMQQAAFYFYVRQHFGFVMKPIFCPVVIVRAGPAGRRREKELAYV
jgi:hypothetical protein